MASNQVHKGTGKGPNAFGDHIDANEYSLCRHYVDFLIISLYFHWFQDHDNSMENIGNHQKLKIASALRVLVCIDVIFKSIRCFSCAFVYLNTCQGYNLNVLLQKLLW